MVPEPVQHVPNSELATLSTFNMCQSYIVPIDFFDTITTIHLIYALSQVSIITHHSYSTSIDIYTRTGTYKYMQIYSVGDATADVDRQQRQFARFRLQRKMKPKYILPALKFLRFD